MRFASVVPQKLDDIIHESLGGNNSLGGLAQALHAQNYPNQVDVRAISGQKALKLGLRTWTILGFLFLYLPIAVLVVYSFNSSRLGAEWQGFTWKWYAQLSAHKQLLRAAQNSLVVATVTTLASIVLGTGGAWLLHRYRYRAADSLQTLIALPMVMPEILMGVSLLVFFTTIGMNLGFTTVIIAHTTFCFPFVLVAVQARLKGLDPSLEEAALDLGATPWRAFWLVILPCLRPAILAGALMAFTLSMDEIIVTYFTSSAASATLPMRIFGMAKVGLNPMLNALSTLFIVVTAAVVLFSEYLKRLRV
ncbi:MAG: ABC transporter permease [Opitutaceae bacterium]|nr:ABC transporter permease [Opitutaceae bacterium]